MQALRQLGGGLFLGLLSVIIVIGGLSLALAEGYVPQPPPIPTETQPIIPSAPTETPSLTSVVPSPTETVTASPIPPTTCPPPIGWVLVMIQPGDTLEILASRYHTTTQALMTANCLASPYLLPGYGIYVPPLPTATVILCGPPYGWIQYIVRPGDNLYQISLLFRIGVPQLQQANCLGYSTTIYPGQLLWVPNVPTSTPPATPIIIEFDTATPFPSDIPTISPTETLNPTPIPTSTPAPTETQPPPTSTATPPTPPGELPPPSPPPP